MTVTKNDDAIEDVTPIETSSEPSQVDPEKEKEMLDAMTKSYVIRYFKNTIQEIKEYIDSKSITLEQLIEEIQNKKCALSKSRRDFMSAFKLDFIQSIFDELYVTRSKVEQFTYDD